MFTNTYWEDPSNWLPWILPLVSIDLILRGISLWRSAQAKQKGWFIALLFINSVGILPALYLFFHRRSQSK